MALAACLGLSLTAAAQKVFFEDFEGLALGPSREEGVFAPNVWTKTPPSGWTVDDSQMPGIGTSQDGVIEWAGWSFASREWWVQTAGDQRRSDFTFGQGAVLIADPDEWDDAAHAKGFWNGFISSGTIQITNAPANSLVLAFDSSWRPEALDDSGASWPTAEDGSAINNQTGLVFSTFNGGGTNQVIRYESTRTLPDGVTDNPFFKEDKTKSDGTNPDEIANTNEPVIVPLNNPAGDSTLKLTFGMIEAANDWWWAVDNIAVGRPPLLTGVSATGVGFRVRIAEALGQTVDDTRPITVAVDGVAKTPVTVTRDGSLIYVAYSQAPDVYAPRSRHVVSVNFTATGGRAVTDTISFTAPSYTTVSTTPAVITATVTSPSYFTVDAAKGASLKLDGVSVNPTSVTPFATDTTSGLVVRYAVANPLPPGSLHTLAVTFTTDGNRQVTDTVSFVAATYRAIPPELGTDLGKVAEPGMRWRTHQLAEGRANSTALVEQQMAGQLGASVHDTNGQNAAGFFEVPYVNFEQSGSAAGIFRADGENELAVPDESIPGIPGTTGSTDNIGGEALAYVEIPTAGIYTMVVRSDDGFEVSVGNATNPKYFYLGGYDGGRGDGPTEFYFSVTKPGVYLFRLLWYEGGGGASVEWFTVNANGTRALVGGQQAGALKAYRVRTMAEPVITVTPASITVQPRSVEIREGETALLSVTATGDSPLAYQWFKGPDTNSPAIAGATTSSLVLGKATAANDGVYTVRVSNSSGVAVSLPATVKVLIPQRSKVLLSQDFEGLPLGPNQDEALAGTAVWTKTAPSGWSIDDSGVPGAGNDATDGVTEWAGWSFASREWWASTAGDQTRSRFVKGTGTVAIADGDEWDDQPRTAGQMTTLLNTPAINVAGLASNTMVLKFDSSWRPEAPQKAVIRVSFDNGAPVEVLRWEASGANFHPDSQNETVTLRINNPATASSMRLTFGYLDAGNNWWWAIDNVVVSAEPAGFDSLQSSLAAYLPFDGTLQDASGAGRNGAARGTPSFVAGKVGQAVNVRTTAAGEFSFVTLGRQLLLGTNSFSVSFWTRLNSFTGDPSFIGNKNWNSGGNVGFVVATAGDSRVQWNFNTVGGSRRDYDSAGGILPTNTWKHVVVTFDRSGAAETWVDGAKLNSTLILANAGQVLDTADLALNIGQDGTGTYTDGGSVFHNADLDEVAIWTRVLADEEIARAYTRGNSGQSLVPAPSAGLTVVGTPPAGLAGSTMTNIQVDSAARTITADVPAGSEQGYLTISPAQTIKSISVQGGRLVIQY